ncbi:hypothetical protein [Halomicrobium sp. LC1Hm]|uniref:hypothetical protein n=1 Tax=Halomicrobium sp. LC1Hm TaxID=2610902 RepID=UPI0012984DFA|nr:hypothetical protein [Halomicrobium sp. LC1Hm]QGA81589.1 Uncharacterized protein LC1Hm_0525 [Halomicrobium sp. LC1Hm]
MLSGELATADLVLVAMALPLVVASLVGVVFSVQFGVAMGAGSVPAGGTLGYALFYDPPASE